MLLNTRETLHIALLLLSPDDGYKTLKLYMGHKGRDGACKAVGANTAPAVLEQSGLACESHYYL